MKQFFSIAFLIFAQQTLAQQTPLTTIFWNNYSTLNPAMTGLNNKHEAAINFRDQWDNVTGAPRTLIASYGTQLDQIGGGIGVNYTYDKIGLNTQNMATLNYSYHLKINENNVLSFGVGLAFSHLAVDYVWFSPTPMPDPYLPTASKDNAFSINLGAVYKAKKFTLGISSTEVNEARYSKLNFQMRRHFYFFGDYTVDLTSKFALKPQVMFRTDLNVSSVDFNLLATYNKKAWLGASLRTDNSFAIIAGYDFLEKIRVGYAYEVTSSLLNNGNSNTHEIVLGFFIR
ncbi:MAG: type IX secretion system membrane protein PorP/SprF [Crocinitomicaceae bacterium]|nr:MAG: type IX secretion system membrane protein PorP/SprF [Crocinitomicaceae bacterium]